MKITRLIKYCALAFLAIAIVACATQPTTPTQKALSEADLHALQTKVMALKAKADGYNLAQVLPEDYGMANTNLDRGSQALADKKYADATSALTLAESGFKGVLDKGLPMVAEERKKTALGSQLDAKKANAEELSGTRFASGTGKLAEADANVGDSKFEEAIAAYDTANSCFSLSRHRANAITLKDKIEAAGYQEGDQDNFDAGLAKMDAEDQAWASNDIARQSEGIGLLTEAELLLTSVYQKGLEQSMGMAKDNADASKQISEEAKADIAARDEYDSAQSSYDGAMNSMYAHEYEGAIVGFNAAAEGFDIASATAQEKKADAREALDRAAEAVEASTSKAVQYEDAVDPASFESEFQKAQDYIDARQSKENPQVDQGEHPEGTTDHGDMDNAPVDENQPGDMDSGSTDENQPGDMDSGSTDENQPGDMDSDSTDENQPSDTENAPQSDENADNSRSGE